MYGRPGLHVIQITYVGGVRKTRFERLRVGRQELQFGGLLVEFHRAGRRVECYTRQTLRHGGSNNQLPVVNVAAQHLDLLEREGDFRLTVNLLMNHRWQ